MIYLGLLDANGQELTDGNYRRIGMVPEMWSKLMWLGEPSIANNEPLRFTGRYGLTAEDGEAHYLALYRDRDADRPGYARLLSKPIRLHRGLVLMINTHDLKLSEAVLKLVADPPPAPERFFTPLAKAIDLGFNTDELAAPDCWL